MEIMKRLLICLFLLIVVLSGCANIEKKDASINQEINKIEKTHKN